MAQVKKAAVREAVLAAANELFMEKGYSAATLSDIAARAGVSMSNIYNYFGSKLDVLFSIYEPWLDQRLDRLAREVKRVRTPRARLRRIFLAVLRDIPTDNNCFANNILQAISTRNGEESYSRALLLRSEAKVSAMIRDALPPSAHHLVENDLLPHLLFMAFDGFAVNTRLNGPSRRVEAIADMLCDLALSAGQAAPDPQGGRSE